MRRLDSSTTGNHGEGLLNCHSPLIWTDSLILSDMSVLSVRRVLTRRPWLIPSFLIKEIREEERRKRDLGRLLKFEPSSLLIMSHSWNG